MKVFLKKYWEYIVAFFIPLLMILIHCATRGVWPCGENSLLRGDANCQYIYIFEELWEKVHSGDFSFFSWNALGGFDFYLNALYYTISPATIVVLLLPKACIHGALQFFMILKWMLMSVTTVYFFMHTKYNRLEKYKQWVALMLSICYVMGNYFLAVLVFFNWLDTLILFPVLLILVERMIDNQKWKLYYCLLTIAMLCNFYIAFPICIFLFLWFLLHYPSCLCKKLKTLKTFLGSSLLAAITSLGVILPCVLNVNERYLLGQNQQIHDYIKSVRMTIAEWLQHFFLCDITDVGDIEKTPFYLSLGVIILGMFFVFVKLKKSEKIGKLIINVFLIVSFFCGGMNYVWHGFSIPHGIDQRYTFIFYMMVCIVALDVICHLEQIRIWHIIVVATVSCLAFVYAFLNIKVYQEFYIYLSTILVCVFDLILIVLYCRRSIKKESFIIAALLVCFCEVCVNAYVQLGWYDVTPPNQMYSIEDVDVLIDELELKSGEKIVINDTGYNTGLGFNVPNMLGFISFSPGKMSDLAMNLGMHVVKDAGVYYSGMSPVLNYLFNISYGIGKNETQFSDITRIAENGELTLFKMNKKSSLGYLVETTATEWKGDMSSVWNGQNRYLECMLGEEYDVFNMFIPEGIECQPVIGAVETILCDNENGNIAYGYTAGYETDGNIIRFTVDRDMDLYVRLLGSHNIKTYASINKEEVYFETQGSSQVTIHIGNVKEGDEVSIVCVVDKAAGERVEILASFAEFDHEVYNEAYKKLSKNLYEVTEMQGDTVKGTIRADEAGIMMTSIPAMNGFTVYVDGMETAYETIGGALIGVPLEAGEHQVEFHYETRYAKLAWLLSFAGVAIFGVICGVDYYRKKKTVQE